MRDDDVNTLFAGLTGATVRVTRMRSDIAQAAMTADFVLQASADQSEVSNVRNVTQSVNLTCPIYNGCNVVGTGTPAQAQASIDAGAPRLRHAPRGHPDRDGGTGATPTMPARRPAPAKRRLRHFGAESHGVRRGLRRPGRPAGPLRRPRDSRATASVSVVRPYLSRIDVRVGTATRNTDNSIDEVTAGIALRRVRSVTGDSRRTANASPRTAPRTRGRRAASASPSGSGGTASPTRT